MALGSLRMLECPVPILTPDILKLEEVLVWGVRAVVFRSRKKSRKKVPTAPLLMKNRQSKAILIIMTKLMIPIMMAQDIMGGNTSQTQT